MRRVLRYIILACCCVLATFLLWNEIIAPRTDSHQLSSPPPSPKLENVATTESTAPEKMVVMGRLSSENADWVEENIPDWSSLIYVVDNTSAPLHTARNKGREANAYLTFIIENYYNLPNISAFIHSHRSGFPEAWHTDAVHHDMVTALNSMNIDHVHDEGYANLRCNPDPGCYGLIIQPRRHVNDTGDLDRDAASELAWLDAWPHLNFTGEEEAPSEIGAACCAQFAVSRDQILQRSLEDYTRYHQWLMDTTLPDEVSGRIMEYSWHMMFGKEPIHCPEMMECYMQLYPGKNPYGIDANGEAIRGPPP